MRLDSKCGSALLLWLAFTCCELRAEVSFTASTIDTGVSERQAVLDAYLRRDDRADLVVCTVADDVRRLRIYELDDDMRLVDSPVVDVRLPDDVVTLDVGKLGARDAILLFTADRAIYFDPFEDTVRPLVEISSIYNNPVRGDLPVLDLFRDINGDGLSDLVITGFKGVSVFLQESGGNFRAPMLLDAQPVMQLTYQGSPWYEPRTMFVTDMTQDGKSDLTFWQSDHFEVYAAIADGFDRSPRILSSNVPFQFDGVGSVSFRMGEEDQSNLTAKALYSLVDLDGDGVTDLVTLTVNSQGVFKKQTTYDIHRGRRGDQGTLTFDASPTSSIRSNGIQFEMQEKDLDSDGDTDVVISSVQLGIARIIGALLTGSVDIDLNFYRMENGAYPQSPNASRSIKASFNLSSGDVFRPFVLIGDVNGDRYADLLAQDGDDTIKVYEGEPGDRLFARHPKEITSELPRDADLVKLADLNADGCQDVVMRLEKKNQDNRVTVLVAR
ncbi:MAG: VCBS repeat-containing protein [Pseudomonadales bacterium]|nr:VCBS repeat-containing protein [Pseudomonadales bacterium]